MGAVDLVLQVESPKSVAPGCSASAAPATTSATVQGPHLPEVPRRPAGVRGRHAARCARGDRADVVPRNPLDVLAQQIVAIARPRPRTRRVEDGRRPVRAGHATHSFAELPRPLLENVLDMLDGRYPSAEFGELRPRIVWDRVGGTIRARKGARALAITNAGTIPDRGLFAVTLPDGRRVGELDEEMVYEARAGQTFLLGRLHLAHRGDRPRPGRRHPGARRAGGGAVLAGRQRRAAQGAGRGDRRVRARAVDRPPRCSSATTTSTSWPRATCSTTCRTAGGHAGDP